MSEIEKLYENAGVEIQYGYDVEYNKKGEHYRLLNCNRNAVITLFPEYKSKGYKVTKVNKAANFTAEKQIEIIKLLTQQCDLTISHFGKWEFIHFDGQEPVQETGENFERVLAKVINSRWDDFFTDAEKAEIKRILEQ